MEYILQLFLTLAQLAIMLVEHAERKRQTQEVVNKKASLPEKIIIFIKKR